MRWELGKGDFMHFHCIPIFVLARGIFHNGGKQMSRKQLCQPRLAHKQPSLACPRPTIPDPVERPDRRGLHVLPSQSKPSQGWRAANKIPGIFQCFHTFWKIKGCHVKIPASYTMIERHQRTALPVVWRTSRIWGNAALQWTEPCLQTNKSIWKMSLSCIQSTQNRVKHLCKSQEEVAHRGMPRIWAGVYRGWTCYVKQ